MKTNVHLWLYLAKFFVELEMFSLKVVEEMKTDDVCLATFFSK